MQDIGFDGISPLIGTDDNVVNMYWNSYFPKAVSCISSQLMGSLHLCISLCSLQEHDASV